MNLNQLTQTDVETTKTEARLRHAKAICVSVLDSEEVPPELVYAVFVSLRREDEESHEVHEAEAADLENVVVH